MITEEGMKREEMQGMIKGIEQLSQTIVKTHARKVIPYKEYAAHKEAERRTAAASKSTSGEEEDWDEEPTLPP